METVFHVSTVNQLSYIDAKVQNLVADDTVEVNRLHVVTDAGSVIDAMAGGERTTVEAAVETGATFRVCSNALRGATVTADDLPEGASVVSSGVGELTRLQARGAAYIRP